MGVGQPGIQPCYGDGRAAVSQSTGWALGLDTEQKLMATNSTRRQKSESSIVRITNENRAGGARLLRQLATELFGAIEDHRKWINSGRARNLETTFEVSGRFLGYAAYIALAYLAFNCVVDIRSGLSTGQYAIPEHVDGSRVALFNILATGLVGPIAIMVIGIGIGWMYNLTTAAANRVLPRFVRPLVHPSIMFAVVVAFAAFHAAVTATVARGYLYAKANIEAASPQEAASIKVIEIPGRDVPSDAEDTGHVSSSEREVVRLRSMFNGGRPCPKEVQGTDLNTQPEAARPEPGLAPSRDCQAEKTAPHE